MRTLGIDLETYSGIDLSKSGVYAYTASADFQILLFAYSFDDEQVQIVDLACGEKLPLEILEALKDERVTKTAFNANFERTCLSVYLKQRFSPISWRCCAVQAAMLGLPLHMEGVAEILNLNVQKMQEGRELIRYFSLPCKPTKINNGRTRNLPGHAPDKWSLFKKYCKSDVEVEIAIGQKLERYPISDYEQELWTLDQKINDEGIRVDYGFVLKAISFDLNYKNRLLKEVRELTGLTNPNSVMQLKKWLLDNGVEAHGLSKKNVSEMAEAADGDIKRMLRLRLDMAKTSIKKYEAIKRAVCKDDRVRGLFQFYGANRTGRWAGRLVQVQNLPQNKLSNLREAREIVKEGCVETLEVLFDSVPNTLSQLIRTAFIPSVGHRFIVADFSAIEVRIISYLAKEKWRLDVFASHGKIYEAAASKMFKVPMEEITKTSPLRQKGKVAELALS